MVTGTEPTVLFIGGLELALLLGGIILLFGASKIPKLARNMGKGVSEFKKARQEDAELKEESAKSQ